MTPDSAVELLVMMQKEARQMEKETARSAYKNLGEVERMQGKLEGFEKAIEFLHRKLIEDEEKR